MSKTQNSSKGTRQAAAKPASRRTRKAAPKRPAAPEQADQNVLALPQDCTIVGAVDMKALLLAELETDDLVVDAGAVERVDTAGLQLLTALVRDRQAGGRSTRWQGADSQIRPTAELLGLTHMLALDAPAAGAR